MMQYADFFRYRSGSPRRRALHDWSRQARTAAALAFVFGAGAGCIPAVQESAPEPAPAWEGALLDAERIASLPSPQRELWEAYLARSRELRALDRAVIAAEVQANGQQRWTPAPEASAFQMSDDMTAEWFRSAEARRIADNILSFQTPSGGWSKRIDFRQRPRQPGESYSVSDGWSYIATFDNRATTEQLRFLDQVYRAQKDERHGEAYLRGVEYIFRSQFPNGCWPQVYPLQGSYHDAATFNDDAIVRILQFLRDIIRDEDAPVPAPVRQQVARSLEQGVDCILASQVVVNGRRTVWGAQHDPITLVPVAARAYEPAALSGGESVDIMEFLMGLNLRDPRVVEAVHAAAAWFQATAIHDHEYDHPRLIPRAGGGPIWARFYEIGTNRPIFSNRDGEIRYSWYEVDEERRRGYAWFRDDASRALQRYQTWARRYPRQPLER